MENKLKKTIAIATLANFVVMNLVYLGLPGTGITIIYLQFAFTPERAQEILSLWGESGQTLFLNTLYLDYIFPILYGYLLVTAAIKLRKKILVFIALLAPLADMLENSIHYAIISHNLSLSHILLSSIAASIKWIAILTILMSVLHSNIKKRTKAQY